MRKVSACALTVSALLLAWGCAGAPAPLRGYIELYANVNVSTQTDFFQIDGAGTKSSSPFTLPGQTVLVVTDVIMTPNAVDGAYGGNVDSVGGNENRIRLRLNSVQQAMLHLPLSSGVVFSTAPRAFGFATNPGAFVVRLLGYLVLQGDGTVTGVPPARP
jgi:hypothetical protein